jgi:hypothetical protein
MGQTLWIARLTNHWCILVRKLQSQAMLCKLSPWQLQKGVLLCVCIDYPAQGKSEVSAMLSLVGPDIPQGKGPLRLDNAFEQTVWTFSKHAISRVSQNQNMQFKFSIVIKS